MKTASQSGAKWQGRASGASQDYIDGARETTKDQAALAIASKGNWQAGLQAAFAAGSFEKGLGRSGKSGWLNGVNEKGANNYGTGVGAASSLNRYTQNSSRFDAARGAAASVARGPKGTNIARVTAVVQALRAAKVGK